MNTVAGQNLTVLDLPFFAVQVNDTTLGSEVAQIFEANPTLPGIIVMRGKEVCGMVARNQFFHRLGRRFGIEIYTPRPITEFLDRLPEPPIIVDGDTIIQQAQSAASPAHPSMSTTRSSSP